MEKLPKTIQKYIDLVYSQKSKLNSIPNLDERKRAACEKLNLDPKEEWVSNLINMKDLPANEQIHHYLISQNSSEYVLYVADEHLYFQLIKRIMDPLKDNDDSDMIRKTKASEQADSILKRLQERALSIWKGEAEVEAAQQRMRIMRPEDRIKELGKKSA